MILKFWREVIAIRTHRSANVNPNRAARWSGQDRIQAQFPRHCIGFVWIYRPSFGYGTNLLWLSFRMDIDFEFTISMVYDDIFHKLFSIGRTRFVWLSGRLNKRWLPAELLLVEVWRSEKALSLNRDACYCVCQASKYHAREEGRFHA